MIVSLSVGVIIAIVVIILIFMSSALDLWGERLRRQTQRDRWERRKPPGNQS